MDAPMDAPMTDDSPLAAVDGRRLLAGYRDNEYVPVDHAIDDVRTFFGQLAVDVGRDAPSSDPRRDALPEMLRSTILTTLLSVRRSGPPGYADGGAPGRGRGGGGGGFRRRGARAQSQPVQDQTVHVGSLRRVVTDAFDAGSRLLADAKPPEPQRVPRRLADDPKLTLRFQDLFAAVAVGDGKDALAAAESLRRDLARDHEIAVVSYDGENDDLFDFTSAAGSPTDPTVRPALATASGEVLHRGLAYRAGPPPAAEPGGSGPAGESGEPGLPAGPEPGLPADPVPGLPADPVPGLPAGPTTAAAPVATTNATDDSGERGDSRGDV
jgi:hypothetical protein